MKEASADLPSSDVPRNVDEHELIMQNIAIDFTLRRLALSEQWVGVANFMFNQKVV